MQRWSTRQVILATLLVLAVGLAFGLLVRYHLALILLFLGIVLGTALKPGVIWLAQRGVPRTASIIMIYLLVSLALGSLLVALVPLIVQQTSEIITTVPEYYAQVRLQMTASPSELVRGVAIHLPAGFYFLTANNFEGANSLDQVARFLSYVNVTTRALLMGLAVLLIAAFWTLERQRVLHTIMRFLPLQSRSQVRDFIKTTEVRLGAYLRAQSLLSLIVGCAALLAYLVIGLPYALVLAIAAGIFEVIPFAGPLLGALPALIVAFSIDTNKALWVVVATGIIQGLENYVLIPRLMRQTFGLNSMVTIIALVTFGTLLGLPGALIAVPISVILQLGFEKLLLKRTEVLSSRNGLEKAGE